jgi:hypothetical protein
MDKMTSSSCWNWTQELVKTNMGAQHWWYHHPHQDNHTKMTPSDCPVPLQSPFWQNQPIHAWQYAPNYDHPGWSECHGEQCIKNNTKDHKDAISRTISAL